VHKRATEPAVQVYDARRIALRCARMWHGNADRDHCKHEQKQKPVAGDQLAD
jgi:hypothetical protein